MELKDLSSNWKKLQKIIQKDQTKTPNPHGLKRKKSDEHAPHQNGVKKHILSRYSAPYKKRKMDTSSKESTGLPRSSSKTNLPILSDNANPASILTPSPLHPDIPNAGLSTSAVPGKYIALDCEMVGIGPTPDQDSQLARVSLVNFHGQQVYDSYVLPVVPITDYRTPISGITPAHLAIARPFSLVQKEVAKLLQDRILIGHAIKHDLSALMLTHPKRDIRDTSRYPEFRKLAMGKTPGLKKLVDELLGVKIQSGMHSSVEDARATMALFRTEKEGFERENILRWGRPKEAAVKMEDGEGWENGIDESKKKIRKKKDKKKKKKKGKK
ncbi:putative RNA exonuclease [Lepidopterella palustris CBS 459.81]|uniref:RNA exonuclease 4 n=1 Tax=Lepidopterella palustris CBS 459.81 TaxID=1314670 RepID=A0A8E2JI42_9PEZI|nr:putative RNA exonuclease [Lepidopterella palustris CBS 459.81]